MVSSKYFITLDLQKQSTSVIVPLKHGENGKQIVISIADGGFPYAISNDCYAVLTAQKPDGKVLYNHCTINENTIIYDVTEQTTAVVGTFPAAINLYGAGDALLVSAKFRIIVDGTIYSEDDVLSAPEVSALTHLVSEATTTISTGNQTIQEGIAAAQAANEATNSANAAAENANNSASAADASVERANTAINSANTAAGNAQTAAQVANSAAANANEAARKTNDAIETAKDASEEANEATKNANEAATKAAQTAKSLMVIGKAEGSAISLDDAIDQFLVGCRIFGKTTQDGTPTPDAPVELMSVGVDGSVGIEVCGKNLLNIKSGTVDGFTIINNGSKIVINGTNPNSYAMRLKLCDVKVVAGMRYCLSGGLSSDNTLVASKAIDTFEIQSEGAAGVYTATETAMFGVYIRVDAGQTLSNYAICPQLEIGSAATGYEAYKGQTLTISTPNGLPGIPVSSGGNYTDATGQQWICDEIDFARGVYVKRLVRKIFDGSEYWRLAERDKSIEKVGIFYVSMDGTIAGFPALCNRYSKAEKNASSPSALGKFDTLYSQFRVNAIDYETTLDEWVALLGDWYEQGNPLEGVFALATPITTDLPKEDLAAYDAIHTYRENTTVYNDASAYMELEYVMDAKKYIDSMISGTILQARVE